METPDLLYDKRDHIAYITLNRPERLNALGATTTQQIITACQDAATDTDMRVVVITGQGKAFCAGADYKDSFQRAANNTQEQWRDSMRKGPNVLTLLLRSMPQPVIASVNGVAVGGGATIPLACDLRIASENARFRFPFAHLGLTPEFGSSWLLQRTVGLGRATAILMMGDFIDAATALQYGLVHRVVSQEDLPAATQELAMQLANLPSGSLRRIKALQQFAQTADLPSTLEEEARHLGETFVSPEHRAVVAQFLQRKKG